MTFKFIFANNLVIRLIVLPHIVLTYDKTIPASLRLSSSLKYAKHYTFSVNNYKSDEYRGNSIHSSQRLICVSLSFSSTTYMFDKY